MLLRPILLSLTLAAFAAPAAAEDVALTFDDLPSLSLSPSVAYEQTTTKRLLRGLRRRRFPATGFVTEGKLEGDDKPQRIAMLVEWLNAGMDLGNHGYSHESLNATPVDAYIADVARGEVVTRTLLAVRGRALRWFRYPFLKTGSTLAAKSTFATWLSAHGYRIAPVTLENADWVFALPYDDAVLRGDIDDAARIRQTYLAFTAEIVPWYRQAAFQLLGRRPAFVFLLHATRLNADSLDQLASILRANDLHPTTLERAMTDPAYTIADRYVGPEGEEWLERWSLTLQKGLLWSSRPPPPAEIAARNEKLSTSGETP
jgi:peptidoglycan/xylan/chitin deacetylase (PgdA/CDA1 family)